MILFICETFFQLINATNIKEQCYKEERADLILTMSSDFSPILEVLRHSNVFENVRVLDYLQERDRDDLRNNFESYLSGKQSNKITENISGTYTDYFMPVDTSLLQKFIYYTLVQSGEIPKVHIFEEGSLTYIQDIKTNMKKDSIKHEVFPSRIRICNNIVEILVYKPELFSAPSDYPINQIPRIDPETSSVISLFSHIFQKIYMPKEKYIFLAEPYAVEGINSDEISILDRMASIVGKENIIVKLHPRMNDELYTMNGYKTFLETKVPWELFVLLPEYKEKVLVTISSSAGITAAFLYEKNIKTVYTYRIVLSQRYHVKHPGFGTYFKKMFCLLNEQEKQLFCPSSMREFEMTIQFIDGEM